MLTSFNAFSAFSINECSENEVVRKISNLYSINVTDIDKSLYDVSITVPDKLLKKYDFSNVHFVVSKYGQIIMHGNLQTELQNKQRKANLTIRKGMIHNLKIYAYYTDIMMKGFYDANFCKFEVKQT